MICRSGGRSLTVAHARDVDVYRRPIFFAAPDTLLCFSDLLNLLTKEFRPAGG
jgi:hypothetical protein